MPFSNALDGFVRGFSVGSEQVRSAQELQMKRAYYDANAEESAAKARYYDTNKGKGAPTDGVIPEQIQEGQGKFGPTAAVPTYGSYEPAPINEENDKLGLPSGHLRKTAELESSLDPSKKNPNSSAGGLFQFTDDTAKDYGLANRFDPVASTKAAGAKAVADNKALTPALGHAPTGPELYLAHNQGPAGAKALLANPNANALAALTPAYKGDANAARQAIINNGGNPDMTAGQFVQQLQKKYNMQAAVGGGSEFAAHGGVVGQYADGGVAQKPYYIDDLKNDLKNDVSNAFSKLGDVVRGGLQGIQEQFGLNEVPAVPHADAKFMQGVEAFQRNTGKAEPEQIEQVKRTVDPDNQLGDALGTTYGMIKSYDYHLSKGDVPSAKAAASSILLYTRSKSQQLGALAYHALENGDETAASKAIEHAFNILPNAQKLQMKDGKALVIDQRTGDVVRELNFTPETLANAAMGFANGQAFLDDLANVTKSEKENAAAITAGSRVDVANINQSGLNDRTTANLDVRKSEGAANRKLKASEGQASRDVKTSEGVVNRELKASEGVVNRESREGVAAGHDATRLKAVDATQAGTTERANIAADTSRANNQNTNQTRRQNTLDTLDAGAVKQANDITDRNDRLDKRLTSQEGIAGQRIASQEKQIGMRTSSSEKIAGENNQTRRDVSSAKNETGLEKTGMNIGDKQLRQNVNNTFKGEQTDKKLQTQKDISGAGIASREKIAGERIQSNEQIATDNREGKQNTAANRAAGVRSSKELDRVNKMTDFEVLGADEAVTPKVSSSQAQATRDIARSLVESGAGKIYGDQGANYARQITAWDAEKKAPKYSVSLKQTNDGYSATMPDGSTIPLSESGYRSIKRIRDMMSGTR